MNDDTGTTPAVETASKAHSPWLLPSMGRGWPWLLYLDLVLPAVLWIAAYLLHSSTIGLLFHNYGMYVSSPAPIDVMGTPYYLTLTGVPGLLLHLYAIARGFFRRDRLDAVLCLLLGILAFLFYFFGLDMQLLIPLEI